MSGQTIQGIFNEVFAENYQELVIFARNDEDLVHDTYEKILKRFTAKPNTDDKRFSDNVQFTGNTTTEIRKKLFYYTKTAIFNTFRTNERLKKFTVQPDDFISEVERVLTTNDILEQDNLDYEHQLEFITEKLFEYIKLKYKETDAYVFRVYFIYDKDNKITYKQLSVITGFSISKCCGIIQTIKADLRLNLINYINNGTGTN